MKRNWKNVYQVWIRYRAPRDSDPLTWECVFATSSPPAAREYAYNRISFGGVNRVEIRDKWGDEVLQTIFDAGWPNQDAVRAELRRRALHFPVQP